MGKKIGILFGMENTFPPAVVEKINSMKVDGVYRGVREHRRHTHGRTHDSMRVIIDRISQDIPFYRAYLKNAMLQGTDRHQ